MVKNKYNSPEQRYLSIDRKTEITSRIPSWNIAQVLEKLAIPYDKNKEKQACYDVVIATNMIAVGMDVDRLGLMSVVGQPKQNSEYIQATSRVGRQHPGIIFTVYNPYRPRDLSNYENFVGFHSQMYRYVEGTTATPFAARARDRVLHALVVSLLRLQVKLMADNGGASNINDISDEQIKDIKDKILERVKITAPLSYVDTECNCGARRVMSGAMQKEKFAGLCCSGNHPHRPGAKAKICKKSVIPSQRGASNVYFTVTRNAISIPPWTNPINDIMGAQRATIETLVEAMGEEAGLSFAYQKYFGDKYSYLRLMRDTDQPHQE